MFTIQYGNGEQKNFAYNSQKPERQLAIACYADNYQQVEKILAAYPDIDVNAMVCHSNSRGNGTPLVLTGSKAIAELLIARGAQVNYPCIVGSRNKITPLDSALKELTKLPVRTSKRKTAMIQELITYLKSLGAKQHSDL